MNFNFENYFLPVVTVTGNARKRNKVVQILGNPDEII
jgi:hypothetical protein